MNKKYILIIFFALITIGYNKLISDKPVQTERVSTLDKLTKTLPKNEKPLKPQISKTENQAIDTDTLPSDEYRHESSLKKGNYVMEKEFPEISVTLILEDPNNLDGKIFMDVGTQGNGSYSLDAIFVRGFGMADDISEGEIQLSMQYKVSQNHNKLNITIISFLYENNEKKYLPQYNLTMIHEDFYKDREDAQNEINIIATEPSHREPAGYDSYHEIEEDNSMIEYGNNSYEFENPELD